jgi:hypothetical protein
MATDRDTTRIVRSWLEEGRTALPDHILDAVLDQVPATRQRRAWWPAWRFADMNNIAKLLIAAAAVVAVAIVGINLLPAGDGGVGGPLVSPSPSPSPTPQASPSPSPAAAFPPDGPLSAGTHAAIYDGIPFSFTVPTSGWRVDPGNSIGKGEYEQPDWIGIDFWLNAPDNVYADPCAHTPLSPPPSSTAAGLAAAAAAVPGTDLVSGPSSTVVGGYPAQHVVLTIREDIGCDPHDAYLWYDESWGGPTGGWRWAEGLGATYRVWITEVDGTLVWIDAYTFPGANPELDQEIQQIVESITFE